MLSRPRGTTLSTTRRSGFSHLAARDPTGGFVMVSKTFKGMTDETLAWQTKELLAREVDREGQRVVAWVKTNRRLEGIQPERPVGRGSCVGGG